MFKNLLFALLLTGSATTFACHGDREASIKQAVENLNLDDSRAEQVYAIFDEAKEERRELKRESREKMRTLRQEREEKLSQILSEDELKQLRKAIKKSHKKFKRSKEAS